MAAKCNWGIFKEPRGFMKLLELTFCVAALAVFSTYTGTGSVTTQWLGNSTTTRTTIVDVYSFSVEYWFTASEYKFVPDNGGVIGKDSYQIHAEFYSGVGSLSFLYVLGIAVCYVFLEARLSQEKLRRYFIADFLLTVIVAILWLVSTAVWIKGALGVEDTVDDTYERFQSYLHCSTSLSTSIWICTVDKPSYGKLWGTVGFGFLNMFLWSSNGWFTFKETPWFGYRGKEDSRQTKPLQ